MNVRERWVTVAYIGIGVFFAVCTLLIYGCSTPRYVDQTHINFIADDCDPRGACKVGKKP